MAQDIKEYLKGIKYPVSKSDVVVALRNNGAPVEVITMVENLPDQEFNNEGEIMRKVSGGEQNK